MKFFTLVGAAVFGLFFGCAEASDRVTVLFTTDTHTHTHDGAVRFSQVAAYRDALREREGRAVFLVDSGDYVQGSAHGEIDRGASVIGLMNAAGYDVATLGNHEFDYGRAVLAENLARARFAVVDSTYRVRADGAQPWRLALPAYAVLTGGATRVAFVGATTPDALTSANPRHFVDGRGVRVVDFCSGGDGSAFCAAVQAAVDAAAAEADYVVLVVHLGRDPLSRPYCTDEVIANVTNVTAVLDGHSHHLVAGETLRDRAGRPVLLAQAGCHLAALGRLDLGGGEPPKASLLTELGAGKPSVAEKEAQLLARVQAKYGAFVAQLDVPLAVADGAGRRLCRRTECSAGDFVADGVWWFVNEKAGLACDVAVINGGSVRQTLPSGPAQASAFKDMQPFGNDLVVVELPGRTLLDFLEWGCALAGQAENGNFPQCAGLRYAVATNVALSVSRDGRGWTGGPTNGVYRVRDVEVYDRAAGAFRPLDLSRTYRVAGCDYQMRYGGGGCAMLGEGKLEASAVAEDMRATVAYARAFARGSDGLPHVSSAGSPLASLPGYPIDYARPEGSGRVVLKAVSE